MTTWSIKINGVSPETILKKSFVYLDGGTMPDKEQFRHYKCSGIDTEAFVYDSGMVAFGIRLFPNVNGRAI